MRLPVPSVQGQEQRYGEGQCFCGRWEFQESRGSGGNPVFQGIDVTLTDGDLGMKVCEGTEQK